jgi:hypothetical protein
MDKTHTVLHVVVLLNVVVVEVASIAHLRSCRLQTELMQLKIAIGVNNNVLLPIIQQVGS